MLSNMTKKEAALLRRILAGLFLFAAALFFRVFMQKTDVSQNISLILFVASYLLVGADILWRAVRTIASGQVFDENFLMSVATIGAFALGEYPEGTAVMLFYQIGELFQSLAVSKSRRSIAGLMDIRPDYANLQRDGQTVRVDPEEVVVGQQIVIRPGERVPLDGVVEEGASTLDTSALTGESAPRDVGPGETVISGCINQTGLLTVRVSREFGESTVSKILELVETAADKKSHSEAFITRFARFYTPVVVIGAVLLAILPPLLADQSFSVWIERALIFLVISCPCALVVSVPLSFFGGIGGASKAGILVKGGNYLEALAQMETVVFDKTGTLTKGVFSVREVWSETVDPQELLRLAAYAEANSSHPIAKSIQKEYGQTIDPALIEAVEELPGRGVRAVIEGKAVLAGNVRLMEGLLLPEKLPVGTIVHLAVDGVYAGYLLIGDALKEDAARAIARLKAEGIRSTVMLTGDEDAVGRQVAGELGMDRVYTRLLPQDKVERVEALLKEKSTKGVLAFVGDGINDAPVLARADLGIAMGGLGSDAAIEAADVVIMTDEPSKLAVAMGISRRTLRIARQNVTFALGVKGIVLVLGALGYASMWMAVFADVGVTVLAILNAIRALNISSFQEEPVVKP